jgi:hypothetical protein
MEIHMKIELSLDSSNKGDYLEKFIGYRKEITPKNTVTTFFPEKSTFIDQLRCFQSQYR